MAATGYTKAGADAKFVSQTSRAKHAPALGAYFLEAEGAVGDGTTNDQPAMAATCTAAAAGRGKVYPDPSKTYGLGTHVTVPANTHIVGGAFKALASSTSRAFLIQNVSDVTLENVTVDLNKSATANGGANTNQQGVYVSNTTGTMARIRLDGVTVKNGHQRGIHVATSGAANAITDLTIDRCTVSDVSGNAVHISATGNADKTTPSTSRRIKVTRCTITNPGLVGVQVQGCSDVDISDNTLDGGGVATSHGIVLSTSGSTSHVTDFTITRNRVTGFATAARWGIVVSVDSKRFTIAGNIVRACTGGITVDPENGGAVGVRVQVDGAVTGNTVTASVGSTGSHGIHARLCEHLSISGNTSRGNAGAGVLIANAFGCAVTGNVLSGNGTYGVQVSGTDAGTGGHWVGPNALNGNTSGAASFTATPVANTIYA